jgi:hypothetical protein
MHRKQFVKIIAGVTAMSTLGAFKKFTSELKEEETLMPVLFIGHGSPMNGIENNAFNAYWLKNFQDQKPFWLFRLTGLQGEPKSQPWISQKPFMILEAFPRSYLMCNTRRLAILN